MVYFSLRASKKNKKGLSPIEASISYNGERIYFSTGKCIKESEWNKQKQMVKGNTQEATLINNYLIELRNKIYEKEVELMKKGYMVTVHLLKDAVLNKIEPLNDKSLMQVLIEHNEEKRKLIGKGVAKSTYYCFEHTKRLLVEFMKRKYQRDDILLNEMNQGFMQSFHTYLLTEKSMSQNTTAKHLKFIKTILNRASLHRHQDSQA